MSLENYYVLYIDKNKLINFIFFLIQSTLHSLNKFQLDEYLPVLVLISLSRVSLQLKEMKRTTPDKIEIF